MESSLKISASVESDDDFSFDSEVSDDSGISIDDEECSSVSSVDVENDVNDDHDVNDGNKVLKSKADNNEEQKDKNGTGVAILTQQTLVAESSSPNNNNNNQDICNETFDLNPESVQATGTVFVKIHRSSKRIKWRKVFWVMNDISLLIFRSEGDYEKWHSISNHNRHILKKSKKLLLEDINFLELNQPYAQIQKTMIVSDIFSNVKHKNQNIHMFKIESWTVESPRISGKWKFASQNIDSLQVLKSKICEHLQLFEV